MRKCGLWILVLLPFLLTGCLAGLTDQQTGTKTTRIYDSTGMVVSVVDEEEAIGDKYTEYGDTVENVAKATTTATTAQVAAISNAMAPVVGEDPVASAYKTAMGFMALSQVKDNTVDAIKSIHYGKDGYTVTSEIVSIVPGLAFAAVGWKAVDATADVLTTALKEVGDTTSIEMGDGNTVDGFNKSEVDSEVHATALAEDSTATVTDPNSEAGVGAKAEAKEETEIDEEETEWACEGCSVESEADGSCACE